MSNRAQNTRKKVAPFNPNPLWPEGYLAVLGQLGVSERRQRFYVHWVGRFFRMCPGRRRRELGRAEIEG